MSDGEGCEENRRWLETVRLVIYFSDLCGKNRSLMMPSVPLTVGRDGKVFGNHCCGAGQSLTLWDGNPRFSVLAPFVFSLASSLSTGHSSSKPDVISQLEREEKLCTKEIHTQRGRRGSRPGRGRSRRSACVLADLRAAARETP